MVKVRIVIVKSSQFMPYSEETVTGHVFELPTVPRETEEVFFTVNCSDQIYIFGDVKHVQWDTEKAIVTVVIGLEPEEWHKYFNHRKRATGKLMFVNEIKF